MGGRKGTKICLGIVRKSLNKETALQFYLDSPDISLTNKLLQNANKPSPLSLLLSQTNLSSKTPPTNHHILEGSRIQHPTHASTTVNLTPTQLIIHLAIPHLLKHHFSNHKEFTGSENRESIQHQLYSQPSPYMDPNGNNQPLTIQTHSSQCCPHTRANYCTYQPC